MAIKDKTIGIPRALVYYNYIPFLSAFFESLGFKIVYSDYTTKKTLTTGSSLVVTETCLPIKVYVGHVVNLIEKGVKNIFVPSIQSIAPKIYNCSKIRGLPDLIRNVVRGDYNIIEATLDKSEKNLGWEEFLRQAIEPFCIKDENKIEEAIKKGHIHQNNFKVMVQHNLPFDTALKYANEGKVVINQNDTKKDVNIALIAHGYNIYDKRASMDVFKKLENLGVRVYSAYNLSDSQLKDGLSSIGVDLYWANQLEMSGAAGYFLHSPDIDGLITITAFGCGPDSLMIEDIKRKSKNFNKPILSLTIDEHTGEAGFVTRLEAFCDMLYRKKRAYKEKNPKEEIKPVDDYTINLR
ncbi:MAG: acyl-CoA dehydratase activase-related protein [Candidatus Gastranaerophilales bacterium]|nr:acyl-CoA dehydratase activase-related protein [Candidatus Gastranaerophilales bacterium]